MPAQMLFGISVLWLHCLGDCRSPILLAATSRPGARRCPASSPPLAQFPICRARLPGEGCCCARVASRFRGASRIWRSHCRGACLACVGRFAQRGRHPLGLGIQPLGQCRSSLRLLSRQCFRASAGYVASYVLHPDFHRSVASHHARACVPDFAPARYCRRRMKIKDRLRITWPASTVVKGAAAWSASRSQCGMEAPGRVRGMKRRHEPRGQPHFVLPPDLYNGPPGRGTFWFRIFIQASSPET